MEQKFLQLQLFLLTSKKNMVAISITMALLADEIGILGSCQEQFLCEMPEYLLKITDMHCEWLWAG
jgi:hypothetical protein